MASYKQIAFVLVVSALILAGMVWLMHRDTQQGEIVLPNAESLEGPLAITELEKQNPEAANDMNRTATFNTNKGVIKLELFEDRMPITTGNFIKLAEEGFYNGTKFHRVIDGFMVQGGDPNSKSDDTGTYGRGGPGYTIQDEFVEDPILSNVRGTIAMANTGQPNSGGSQFFINLVDNTSLDFDKEPFQSKHPVFGRVIEGLDVIDAIAKVDTDGRDVPTDPVVIESVTIE